MGRQVPKRADWRVADGVRVEELDGSWLALDPSGGVVYRLEARAAEVMRLVAHRLPLPGHLVPAARELAGHGVLEHPSVDRRTAMVGAGVVTLTGLAATLLPSAARAASVLWTEPGGTWPARNDEESGGTIEVQGGGYYVHVFKSSGTFILDNPSAITDISVLVVGGGGSGGRGATGAGGGGGAGRLLNATSLSLDAGNYTVIIGAGGAGSSTNQGNSGASSVFRGPTTGTETTALVAVGGGGGGGPDTSPRDGGSGGGAGGDDGQNDDTTGGELDLSGQLATVKSGGVVNSTDYGVPLGVLAGFGFRGGNGYNYAVGDITDDDRSRRRGGGGGGAGSAGVNGGDGVKGDGGAAVYLSQYVVGSSGSIVAGVFAGGGGGGGGSTSTSVASGAGGAANSLTVGGAGGYNGSSNPGTAGVANTGSGGGASVATNSAAGGSGIVIVRYRLA